MRKIFDFALICVIVTAVVYACSEDYFAPYEENLELNAHDPRLELIACDSVRARTSQIEQLTFGEHDSSGGQMVKLGTLKCHTGSEIGLYTIVSTEFIIDTMSIRHLTYAEASMTFTRGTIPAGKRLVCHHEVPTVTWSDDKIYLEVDILIDESFYFIEDKESYKYHRYVKTIDAF